MQLYSINETEFISKTALFSIGNPLFIDIQNILIEFSFQKKHNHLFELNDKKISFKILEEDDLFYLDKASDMVFRETAYYIAGKALSSTRVKNEIKRFLK